MEGRTEGGRVGQKAAGRGGRASDPLHGDKGTQQVTTLGCSEVRRPGF